MRILFVGDIVGKPGRRVVSACLGDLRRHHSVGFVIANCENAAGGLGLTRVAADELFESGIDVLTSGNHIWRKRDGVEYLATCDRILRPANYPAGAPGSGSGVYRAADGRSVGVLNLQGRTFMQEIDCPFRVGAGIVASLRTRTAVVVVDLHAEATSEKIAMGWHLAGSVSAVLGTHTHVQTADERIIDDATACITDVGMTGAIDSVIGMRKELALARFISQLPQRFEPAGGRAVLNAVLIDVDGETGRARGIERISFSEGQDVGG